MKSAKARPDLVVPPDLKAALARARSAKATFDALAYTHRKEHINALLDAKKPETRARRLAQTMAMLSSTQPTRAKPNSSRPAPAKMGIKSGQRVLLLDADAEAMQSYAAVPKGTTVDQSVGKGGYDVVILYAETTAKLARRLPTAIKAAGPGAILWIGYPKQASGRATTLTRDSGWEPAERARLTPVTMVALDAVWSGVKYRLA